MYNLVLFKLNEKDRAVTVIIIKARTHFPMHNIVI